MQTIIHYISTFLLVGNIIIFSAGINLVDYYCGNCQNNRQHIFLPIDHLIHEHQDGHCDIPGDEHHDKKHSNHTELRIDQPVKIQQMDIKLQPVALAVFFHAASDNISAHFKRAELQFADKKVYPPDILLLTSVLII
ncbi:MAG: hypothetical protein R6V38_13015 [Roseovarius gahaiensis]